MLHYCLNPHCYYEGILLGVDDVVWADSWDSQVGDLLPVAKCPSCREFMAIAEPKEYGDMPKGSVHDGTLQIHIPLKAKA